MDASCAVHAPPRRAVVTWQRTKALVVASATSRDIFTAGNDIKELHAPSTSEARFRRFWRAQTGCLVAYLRSPLPVAAAIGGACPAGGCALALCCERRVMLDSGNKATIGLNEVALGIAVPAHWGCRMAAVIGERRAEEMLTGGAMLPPKEAAAVGLVDALAGDEETLLRAAHNWAARAAKAAPQARARTKLALPGREAAAAAWWAQVDEEAAASWAMLSDKRVSGALGAVLQRLSSGGKKAVGKL